MTYDKRPPTIWNCHSFKEGLNAIHKLIIIYKKNGMHSNELKYQMREFIEKFGDPGNSEEL